MRCLGSFRVCVFDLLLEERWQEEGRFFVLSVATTRSA
jgi:hypothetical protein